MADIVSKTPTNNLISPTRRKHQTFYSVVLRLESSSDMEPLQRCTMRGTSNWRRRCHQGNWQGEDPQRWFVGAHQAQDLYTAPCASPQHCSEKGSHQEQDLFHHGIHSQCVSFSTRSRKKGLKKRLRESTFSN